MAEKLFPASASAGGRWNEEVTGSKNILHFPEWQQERNVLLKTRKYTSDSERTKVALFVRVL